MAVKIATASPVTIASGGTAVQVSNQEIAVTSVTIQASFNNVGRIQVGDSTVTTSNGVEIPPGDTVTITGPEGRRGVTEFYLSDIYVNSGTSGDTVRIIYWKQRI